MWYDSVSKDSDVVISSRVRFARNIDGYKFPHILNTKEQLEIVKIIEKNIDKDKYSIIKIKDVDENNKFSLFEKHLISKEFINNDAGAIIVNDDYSLVTMVNEEDHLRIQSFESGLNIDSAYSKLKKFTDEINRKIRFAINERYGYVTSCPTNVGSAMRVSVMLHLPGLAQTGLLNKILEQVSNIGFVVRGLYGENTGGIGNIYQISNQKTLGILDKDIIYNVKAVISTIVEQERRAREILLNESITFEDSIYRAYGILKYARVISLDESLNLLSKLRVGISMGIINDISLEKIQKLMIDIEPYTLKLVLKDEFINDKEDVKRGEYIRKEIG